MEKELYHYGIKGMKWGVRRYRNADGSLTTEGKKKYRKEYNSIKRQQILSERAKNVNGLKTSSESINSVVNNYNSKYYDRIARNKMNLLMKKIGDKGLSQLDEDVISEGKIVANKVKKEAEAFNKSLDLSIDDNYLWLRDPQREYDDRYNKYLNDNMIKR